LTGWIKSQGKIRGSSLYDLTAFVLHMLKLIATLESFEIWIVAFQPLLLGRGFNTIRPSSFIG